MAGLEQVSYKHMYFFHAFFPSVNKYLLNRHCGEHFVGREGIIHNLIKETDK